MNIRTSKLLIVFVSIFWMPQVFAGSCSGIHITGEVSGNAPKLVITENSAIEARVREKFSVGSTFEISKGVVKNAEIVSSATCDIVDTSNGAVSVLKISNATIKDANLTGASLKLTDGSTQAVANVSGILTGVDISIASVIASTDQNNDPLNLAKNIQIITLSSVEAIQLKRSGSAGIAAEEEKRVTIPAATSLHYLASDARSYTVFTTRYPGECWIPINGICSASILGWNISEKSKVTKENFSERTYVIRTEELRNKISERSWTSGVLIVPYKFVFASSSLASGSFTIGPYAGYTTDLWGSEWTFPLVAGITKVSVPSLQNGVARTTEKAGLTIATGVLFSPGGKASNIKTGFILGIDELGKDSGYDDNGKLWLGLYVGAGF